MIPKRIHWGAFGGWQLSALNHTCMATWRTLMPDCEVIAWNDDHSPGRPWFRQALKESPINAHNYIGIYALWRFGGVMLDNDVELIRPLDLDHGMIVGFQYAAGDERLCINNAVLGATARHPVIGACLRRMEEGMPNGDPLWFGCGILTEELRRIGMRGMNVEQKIGDVMIYDRERFYPAFHDEPKIPKERLSERTIAVHHWEGSWQKKKSTHA